MTELPDHPAQQLLVSEQWRAERDYDCAALTARDMAEAARAIQARPDYAPTPLRALPGLARTLALGEVLVKDEGRRFGQGGVKALGAPYALQRLIAASGQPPAALTAVAATDGNHGLALAWAATASGCRSRIFVGTAVDAVRIARIRAAGAEVVVVDGTYDDAVEAAAQAALAPGALLITDTDTVGDLPVTRAIMAGYSVLAREVHEQGGGKPFTHVFLQCGVGGVAAGVAAGLWHLEGRVPRVVLVEPERAASMLASLAAGRPLRIAGDLETRMIGLACGEPSRPAWDILRLATFAAMTVGEDAARQTQQALAAGVGGDAPLASGDTGISGLAGLCVAAVDARAREQLMLDASSRVLLISSEGPLA